MLHIVSNHATRAIVMEGLRTISFTVPGRIGGKGRPRFGNGRVFTPAKTVREEAMVRSYAHAEMKRRKLQPLVGPVSFCVTVFHNTPKSWPAKRKAATRWLTGRPDADNVAKLIADALNGLAYADDAQIALLTVQRLYDDERRECVIVSIRELEPQL